ncbi:MAG: alcohol dehydrogenase catalytic domain-containing protein, partial [Bradyrhizobium sp.]|uniref:alcohol dehydrogenase catalytic domain-containing protein n=1 Tax=Bradyrhizobium sp. TaxID=376 RepID=UPI00391BB34C
MKAVVVEQYAPIDRIGLKEIATPDPAAGQIRVRVHAASIGFVDGLKVEGRYQTKDALPFTPGAEFAGVVDAVASDVTGIAPGMRVMGAARSGALAEHIVVPPAAVEIMPDGLSMEAAAAFRTNYLTALYALAERVAPDLVAGRS